MKGEYFNNDSLKGSPALVRADEKVNFRWGEGSYVDNGPVDHFSVRWTGYFVPDATDDYKSYVSAADGVQLYIDDERVIDDWQRHGETLDTASKHVTAGQPYKIRLEYFENTGTATARFGVASATRPLGENTKKVVERADAVVLCMGFKLDALSFSFFDVKKHDWNAEPGEFTILVGSSSAKIEL